jgi:excisionase family DNA binding protein
MGKALSMNELCSALGISSPTALDLMRSGRIPAVQLKKRGQWRIAEEEVQKFLRSGGVEVSGGESKVEAIQAA